MEVASGQTGSPLEQRLVQGVGSDAPSAVALGGRFFVVRGASVESAGTTLPATGLTRLLAKHVWPQNTRCRGHTPRPWRPLPANNVPPPPGAALLDGGPQQALRLAEVRTRAEEQARSVRRIGRWREKLVRGQQPRHVQSGRVSKAEKRTRRNLLLARASSDAASRGTEIHQHVSSLLTMDSASFLRTYGRRPSPTAVRFLRSVMNRGIFPVRAEFCVGDAVMPVATAIDLLGFDARGRAVFIELKTGHEGGAFEALPAAEAQARLREPPTRGRDAIRFGRDLGLANCARDRATLQHLVGVAMAAEHYELEAGRDYVAWMARVDNTSDAIDWYELPTSLLRRGPAVLEALRAIHARAQARKARQKKASSAKPAARQKRRSH